MLIVSSMAGPPASRLVLFATTFCGLSCWLIIVPPVLGLQDQPLSSSLYDDEGIATEEAREGGACIPGMPARTGECSTHCRCESWTWKCCRVRKEYADLSPEEVKVFSETMHRARVDPVVGAWFRKIVLIHEVTPVAAIHHYPPFLFWHRMVVFLLETLIRKHIDCHFTMPYADVTKRWKDWWKHSIWDSNHLGGNGSGKNCCVQDGPFRKGKWWTQVPHSITSTCIKRHFNTNLTMPSPKVLSVLLKMTKPSDFEKFNHVLFHDFHNRGHFGVGGYMGDSRSINDPFFWVLHCFMDKVYTTWQTQGDGYLNTSLADNMEGAIPYQPSHLNFSYADFNDNMNLPHNVHICYTSSSIPGGEGGKYFVPGCNDSVLWSLPADQSIAELVSQMSRAELDQLQNIHSLLAHAPSHHIFVIPGDCLFNITEELVQHPENFINEIN